MEVGQHMVMVSILASRPCYLGLIHSISEIFSEEKYVYDAEVNQGRCLEER